jgi:hypothetical protein
MDKRLFAAIAASGFLFSITADAEAQMGTRPFSFDSSGRTGISTAGKQAIINQELFDATPNVLLKSEDGPLLGLLNGPGSTAIVTSPEGEILPSYRGRPVNRGLRAGEFNEFFLGSDSISPPPLSAGSTGETVDSWTATVVTGRPSGGYSSVDQWTSMVYLLDR